MRIAICLNAAPGYSETFIRSKILGLIRGDARVKVFLFKRHDRRIGFSYVNPLYGRVGFVTLPFVFLGLLVFRFSIILRFVALERSDGHKISRILKNVWLNAHLFFAGRFDWIHFEFATAALGRENVAGALRAKMAVSFRGYDIMLYPFRNKGCYHSVWKKVDKVHTISYALYRQALDLGLSESTAVAKIMPAIDLRKVKLRQEIGNVGRPVKILSVGRLEWKKGFLFAILGVRALREMGLEVEYSIAGTGSGLEELQYTISRLGLDGCVHLLGDCPHEEVFEMMRKSELYIQPSVQEGFCNSLIEAQATGLLCIGTRVGGIPENIIEGETGWLVEPYDWEQLAHCVIKVVNLDLESRYSFAKRAISHARQEFDLNAQLEKFYQFYSDQNSKRE
jgi:colanic acid/amylovoran biosynthesis glycosyltransferase